MKSVTKKSGFRLLIQGFMLFAVLGIFIVACGSDDPILGDLNCGSDGVYCHNAGLCCPNEYPYYCSDKTDESKSKDGCFQSATSGCDVQFELCT